ncbi:MAG: hypothetical protein ACKVQK_28565 [Burkholderiales bacterium]
MFKPILKGNFRIEKSVFPNLEVSKSPIGAGALAGEHLIEIGISTASHTALSRSPTERLMDKMNLAMKLMRAGRNPGSRLSPCSIARRLG